jgi:hypothetical protein
VNREHVKAAGIALALAAFVGAVLFYAGYYEAPWETDRAAATVTVTDENGTTLAVVETEVADTRKERIQGLSGRERLADGRGMLFVHGGDGRHTFVMREMQFGLDIVFVAANGTVTRVAHAPPPGPNEDGEDIRRSGYGKWVLELPRGYANETGISRGDQVAVDYGNASA